MTDDDVQFDRTPGGYLVNFTEVGILIEARQVRWEHGSLYAVMAVKTRIKGVKTIGTTVTEIRVNLSGERGRQELAKACDNRGPGLDIDWRGIIEDASIRILAAEREGRPFQTVGRLPTRIDPGYTIRPLFPREKVAFLYGPGGATKGFLAAALCMSVETGEEVVPGLVPTARGRAMYLDWESDQWDLDDRVKRIASGLGWPKAPEIGYRECFGPFTDQVDDIEREVHRTGVTFLVVDSAGMALSVAREGGDANESTIRMFSALKRLQVTCLVIDHVVGAEIKPGGRASSKPYGSVYKVNLARNTYEIRPLPPADGDSEAVRHIVIRHRKANMSGYLPDLAYSIAFDDGKVRWTAEEVRSVETEETTEREWPPSTRVKMRGFLERGHAFPQEIADAIEVTVETVERVLRRYGPKAAKEENRWFGRVASGKAENLPVDPEVLTKAGLEAVTAPAPARPRVAPQQTAWADDEEPDDGDLDAI
jgi:hypothetical protein